jgi:hypothetical protein
MGDREAEEHDDDAAGDVQDVVVRGRDHRDEHRRRRGDGE